MSEHKPSPHGGHRDCVIDELLGQPPRPVRQRSSNPDPDTPGPALPLEPHAGVSRCHAQRRGPQALVTDSPRTQSLSAVTTVVASESRTHNWHNVVESHAGDVSERSARSLLVSDSVAPSATSLDRRTSSLPLQR